MDLRSLLILDCRPRFLELVLHLVPDPHRVGSQLLQLLLCLVLQLPQSVSLLNDLGLAHQEIELLEIAVRGVVPPSLLDHDGCHRGTTRSFILFLRILYNG